MDIRYIAKTDNTVMMDWKTTMSFRFFPEKPIYGANRLTFNDEISETWIMVLFRSLPISGFAFLLAFLFFLNWRKSGVAGVGPARPCFTPVMEKGNPIQQS